MRTRTAFTLAALALAAALFGAPAGAQQESRIFVVYGSFYADRFGTPAQHNYIVTVENETRALSISVPTATGADQGKYSAVFISTGAEPVAAAGDVIRISARETNNSFDAAYALEIAGPDDIMVRRMRINLIEGQIAVESRSWGAIKALFGG